IAVKAPPQLVQHFAEGHDVNCAEGSGLGNTAAAVVHAITAAAVEVKCRGAKAGQGVVQGVERFRYDNSPVIRVIASAVAYEVSLSNHQHETVPAHVPASCESPGHNKNSVPGDVAAKCQVTIHVDDLRRRSGAWTCNAGSWTSDNRLGNHAFDTRCQALQGSDCLQVWRQGGRNVLDIRVR